MVAGITCPHCSLPLANDPNLIGLMVACPKCQHQFVMPPFGMPVDPPRDETGGIYIDTEKPLVSPAFTLDIKYPRESADGVARISKIIVTDEFQARCERCGSVIRYTESLETGATPSPESFSLLGANAASDFAKLKACARRLATRGNHKPRNEMESQLFFAIRQLKAKASPFGRRCPACRRRHGRSSRDKRELRKTIAFMVLFIVTFGIVLSFIAKNLERSKEQPRIVPPTIEVGTGG